MGTVVSHQVSTTVALSSVKLSVPMVTNTQVNGRNKKKEKRNDITFTSAVMSQCSTWKLVSFRLSLSLVTITTEIRGPLMSLQTVRKTKYEQRKKNMAAGRSPEEEEEEEEEEDDTGEEEVVVLLFCYIFFHHFSNDEVLSFYY